MALKSFLRFSLFCCMVAGLSRHSHAQVSGSIKATPPAGASYSKEETSASTPELAQKEADLRAALGSMPESPSLLYALALVLRQENKVADSLKTYTQAAKYRKPTPEELRSVALDYVLLKDFDDAIHWLEVAATMDPSDVNILYALGRCYYSKNRFADAGKIYEQVLAIQPRHLKAEENLGLVYEATNRAQEAEAALRKAASWANANGTDEWPFLDLGDFLLDQNRAKDAIEPLRIAVRIQPGSAPAHEKLGRALLADQQSAAGISELEESTKLDPRNPKAHYELGRALRQAGQMEQAKKEFALSQQLYATHSVE